MATYDAELLAAAQRQIARKSGQRGRLPSASIRRSISTSYYALFQFLLDEVGIKVIGPGEALRRRRRILTRTLTHAGIKTTLDKVRGANADPSVAELLRPAGFTGSALPVPRFAKNLAVAFSDAQAKRHDADYDLNKSLSETDARLLHGRVKQAINGLASRAVE